MTAQPARTDVELRMVEAMVDCAHALGVGFAEAARGEPDLERRMALDAAFHRGFLAVRMGIRLSLTLRAGAAPAVREVRLEAERPEADRPETDSPDRERLADPPERERERDYEPVSLDRFLKSLRGVAADAGRLQADAAVLAKLEGLLAQVDPPSRAGVAPAVRPPPAFAKSRFLGSTAPAVTLGALGRPRPPPHASG